MTAAASSSMPPPPKESATTTAATGTTNATTDTKKTTGVRSVRGVHSGTEWEVTPPLRLLQSNITATLYRSPVTNLRALLVKTDEPLCTLHVILATEATTTDWCHKDDGLPHTLEHAVFLGSELYPYKGILDKLANRSLADGTNAWTATDHTAYTLTTAGSEGVLNLLPIFADHVLYPTLAEEGFVTEVHHVTSEGRDKGVVYCEMQGRENTDGSLVDRALLDLLYPDVVEVAASAEDGSGSSVVSTTTTTTCGYSSETGGKMKNLRSLNVDQVRRYHVENYTPDNVMFVLSGNVGGDDEQEDDDVFLNAMDEVERRVREKGQREGAADRASSAALTPRDGDGDGDGGRRPGGRPWHRAAVPPMDTSKVGVMPPIGTEATSTSPYNIDEGDVDGDNATRKKTKPLEITFPSEDESRGTVSVGWRGPSYHQRREWIHLRLLWRYLTESAASPLQKAFVECEDPLCAHVGPAHEVFTEGYHQLWLTEVETGERMGELVMSRLVDALRSARRDFDIERMGLVVRRYRRKLLEGAERRPTDSLIDGIVRNFLYAPRHHAGADGVGTAGGGGDHLSREMDDLSSDADELALLEEAETLDARSWLDVMDRYILSRPYAVVVGRPSAQLAVDMAEEEKAREEEQARDLGEERLRLLGEELERAIEYNERDIPEETLTSVPIPSLDKVKPIPLLTIRGVGVVGSASSIHEDDPSPLAVAPNSGRGVDPAHAALVLDKLRTSAVASSGDDASPFYVDWNHIDSAFLSVAVGMSTESLTTRQRLYLPLMLEIVFKLPATLDDGSVLTKDEFVSRLEDDTVSYGADVGLLGSSAPQMASVSVQVENNRDASGLDLALVWIRRVLYLTTVTAEAVTVAVQRLASEIPPQIRDGSTVLRAVGDELNYDPSRANVVSCSPLRQRPFLAELSEMISEESSGGAMGGGGGGAEGIVRELNDLRAELVQSKHMQLFVAGNLMDVTEPMRKIARSLLPPDGRGLAPPPTRGSTVGHFIENVSASSVLRAKSDDSSSAGRAAVCALSAIESSFLAVTAPGVGAYHPDHASLLVAIEYLTALEGDFWIKIRGAGLSYGASIRNSTDSKLLRFGLYKCTDVAGAFEAAADIIVDYASGKVKMSRVELENAKSSLAYGIIAGVSTKLGAATDAWVGHYQGKGVDYDQWLLSKISEVTEEDAMHALVKFLVPMFDAGSGSLVVTCPTNKMDTLCEYFTTRGWTSVKRVPEDRLCSAFADRDSGNGGETEQATGSISTKYPDKVAGVSMFMPGAFAAQFQCGCPKCGRT